MIKNITINECAVVVNLAKKLWPYHSLKQLEEEFSTILTLNNYVVFVYFDDKNGKAKAFAQCEVKYDYVDGTETENVGYLNGIYVNKNSRNHGIAKELLCECESWAKNKGCTRLVCDYTEDSPDNMSFYTKTGFEETKKIIHFTKPI